MAEACRRCLAPLPDGARFCANCGAPVDAAPSTQSVAGERKPVTALFADVVGSVTLAESMDPEDWSVLMSHAIAQMATAVRGYDGTIAKLLGDGVLALFGAEASHEDDPERAVRAAIDMLQGFTEVGREFAPAGGRDFDIRIGINTGLALVGSVSASEHDRGDTSAYGDTVNVAARIQAAAAPGHALLTDATWRLVSHIAEARDLGELAVKGRSEPVHAYELVGLRATPTAARGITGLSSPMVGREGPYERLRAALDTVLAEGEGRVSVIVGEPGIGKSRLVAELRPASLDRAGARWLEAQARALEETTGDALLQRLVGSMADAQLDAGLPSDPIVDHLLARPVGTSSAHIAAELDAQTPEMRRLRYLDAIEGLVRALCRDGALIVVLEDLHWADASSIDALIRLLPSVAELPALLLATTRPDTNTEGWRLVEAAHGRLPPDAFEQISLGPLTDGDTRRLVSNLLEIDSLPNEIRDRILVHADGNPFFIEETVRMLLERGAIVQRDERWVATESIARVEIPRTIHSLLLARIDRLAPEPRQALRVGSVVGREFGANLLRDVQARAGLPPATDAGIAALQASGLVRTRGEGPQVMLRFRHALVQEAAYDSLLRAERATLHRAVAEALESEADPQSLVDLAATISEHFEAADDPQRALDYARRAAEAAFSRYALPEAIAQYRRAIGLADQTGAPPPDRQDLYLRAGRAIELTDRYQDAIEHYSTMLDTSRVTDDRRMELAALTARSIAQSMAISSWRDPAPAQRDADAALELARKLGDRVSEATVWWALMLSHRSYGAGVDEGPRYGLQAIALSDEQGLERQAALARQDVARSYDGSGRFREALELLNDSVPYWRRVNELPSLADGLRLRSAVLWQLGESSAALEQVEEARLLDETTRNAWGRCFSRIQRSEIFVDMARFEEAIADLRESVDIADTTDVGLLRIASRASLIVALIESGDIDGARMLRTHAVHEPDGDMGPMALVGHSLDTWIETAAGRLDAARDALERSGPPGTPLFGFGGVRFWVGPVLACLALGRPSSALERVDVVLAAITRAGARLWEADSRWLRARALMALDDAAGAEDELLLALAAADATGQRLHRDQMEALLAGLESVTS